MKIKSILSIAVLLAATACNKSTQVAPVSVAPAVKANWSSSDKYANWSNGGYTVYNNVWGANAGTQSIWANSYSNWGVYCNHTGSGIKSYPNSSKYVGKTLSSIASLKSSFNCTTPSGGAWESTYDIWDSNKKYETMLWMNYTGGTDGSGNVKPIAASYNATGAVAAYKNVSVGGYTWNVFKGNNGSISVVSFLCTSKTNSGTVDVLAIQRWIQSKGWFGNITQGDVQYGFEITNTNGGVNFQTNSYSVSYN